MLTGVQIRIKTTNFPGQSGLACQMALILTQSSLALMCDIFSIKSIKIYGGPSFPERSKDRVPYIAQHIAGTLLLCSA